MYSLRYKAIRSHVFGTPFISLGKAANLNSRKRRNKAHAGDLWHGRAVVLSSQNSFTVESEKNP